MDENNAKILKWIIDITRNFTNTIDASQTVVPKCFELGSYHKKKKLAASKPQIATQLIKEKINK